MIIEANGDGVPAFSEKGKVRAGNKVGGHAGVIVRPEAGPQDIAIIIDVAGGAGVHQKIGGKIRQGIVGLEVVAAGTVVGPGYCHVCIGSGQCISAVARDETEAVNTKTVGVGRSVGPNRNRTSQRRQYALPPEVDAPFAGLVETAVGGGESNVPRIVDGLGKTKRPARAAEIVHRVAAAGLVPENGVIVCRAGDARGPNDVRPGR